MPLEQTIQKCKDTATELWIEANNKTHNKLARDNFKKRCQDQKQLINYLTDYARLLEKQQPRKCESIETPVVKWGICPTCHGLPPLLGKQRRIFAHENYCSNCGQRIDWTEV